MTVIRPSDATRVVEAWRAAITHRNGPVALVLTRQKVAVVDRTKYAPAAGLHRGGYILADSPNPDIVLMATGSEVELILGAYEKLKADGRRPRAVSMPCLEYFAKQSMTTGHRCCRPPPCPVSPWKRRAPQSWYRWVGENGRDHGHRALWRIRAVSADLPGVRTHVDGIVAQARIRA